MRRLIIGAGVATALVLLPASPAAAHGDGDHPSANLGEHLATEGESVSMQAVANVQYDDTGEAQRGSDIEFVRIGHRDFALAGTLRKGMQIVNIDDPRNPRKVAEYDCDVSQGDIQVWPKGDRVFASYTADGTFGAAGAASQCASDLGLGPDASGTVIVNITRPANPRTVGFAPVPRGSHNMTVHPSGNYLYNSNSDLISSTEPTITIYDIRRPAQPEKVRDFRIPFVPASLGSESHDITFNRSGTRAYSAALSQTLVLDTSHPRRPEIISGFTDPAINVVHQSDPVTLRTSDGDRRRLLVVTDERAGAAGSVECPGGGLHVYDITGDKVQDPLANKVGTWFIPTVQPQAGGTCTSHVLRIYPRQEMLTVAWYTQGVRVLDISGLADYQGSPDDIAVGDGIGMREIGHYVFPDADAWSFKTNEIRPDGSFFGYANDLTRGLDVYRFSGADRSVPALRPQDPRGPQFTRPDQPIIGSAARGAAADAALSPALLLAGAPLLVLAGVLRLRTRRQD